MLILKPHFPCVYLVKDAINKVGDAKNIPITKELLRFVKEAHAKSVIEDDLKKEKKEEQQKREKEKERELALAKEHNLIDLKIKLVYRTAFKR